MKYLITKATFETPNKTPIYKRTFQVEGETNADALNAASKECTKIATRLSNDIGVHIEYSYTGDFVEANYQIIGDNGITEGPMTELEAAEAIQELTWQFPEANFEIKEVK